MVTVSIKNFVDALSNAPTFNPPVLDAGVQYLKDNLHNRLKNGIAVAFSEIDFSAFDSDDFDALDDFESWEERRNEKTAKVVTSLQNIKPVVLSGTFI